MVGLSAFFGVLFISLVRGALCGSDPELRFRPNPVASVETSQGPGSAWRGTGCEISFPGSIGVGALYDIWEFSTVCGGE